MKLKDARISLLVNADQISIEVEDAVANTVFLRLELTPEQFARALSRQMCTECAVGEVFRLDRIGKKHEHKRFEFPLSLPPGAHFYGHEQKDLAVKDVLEHCPEGWIPDSNFGSQDSFFEKDGAQWARCTIRRYVSLDEED